ncbi:MAG: 2,3-bisphosphoglycerate-independent phosphoglycerate mutase [bacterium]|nr:2,3-bisphosphoglycerate-independent phosphoglycerate mutase [bacterium]
MNSAKRPTPLVLLIIDGYGISSVPEGNAIMAANQPNMKRYMKEYPLTTVRAGGADVGLPWGEMGNSETGHQNIGSGRIVYQFLPRIDSAIADKSFFDNKALIKAINHVKKNKDAALHTMGMLSNGGVHSHINHQIALLTAASEAGIGDRTFIHIFLDGRDSSPDDGESFVGQLEDVIKKTKSGKIETIVGRYYAMDRAQNWEVTKEAYDLLVEGKGKSFPNWKDAMRAAYVKGEKQSFESASPMILGEKDSIRTIQDGDAVIFYNYRSDRARQLTAAFADPAFNKFPVTPFKDVVFATMASFDEKVKTDVFFPDAVIPNTLGEIIADSGLTQLRIAESEKFAHVTYFFNAGRDLPYKGETDIQIPSIKTKDFAQHPKMCAKEITDRVVEEIEKNTFDVIVMNYANPDMVGHTGKFQPTVEAVEYIDKQIGRVVDAALANGGGVLLTCDHGNAEMVINHLTHKQTTDHTNSPVPVMYISADSKLAQSKNDDEVQQILGNPIGFLADVAPTALEILGLPAPKEMTAQSLLSSLS